MDLRQIEQVLAVFDHGSVTAAARSLHLAQPSVSETLRRTERELGTPLFHRVGRRLVPTPAGDAFVGPARQLLRDRDGLLTEVAAITGASDNVVSKRAGRKATGTPQEGTDV